MTKFGVLSSLGKIPDGSTVTPVNSYTIWLACAEISDTFGSLASVISSSTARGLLTDNLNALRYMVRSSDIMEDVLDDSDWVTALDNCDYVVSVPTMTSNTTPSGVASSENVYSGTYDSYKCLDGTGEGLTISSIANDLTWWTQYLFADALFPYKFDVAPASGASASVYRIYKIQGSNDGTTFVDLTGDITSETFSGNTAAMVTTKTNDSSTAYKYYRYVNTGGITGSGSYAACRILQIYGLDLS